MATPIQQDFELAIQHHQAGRLAQAEPLYRQILVTQPNHPDALHLLGVLAHQVGRHDAAVDLIRRAITLRPNWPEALNHLAGAFQSAGQFEQANEAARRAIALRPSFSEAHCNLGISLKESGQVDLAVAAFGQAISHRANYPEAYNNLSVALAEQGKLEEAVAAARQALNLRPNYPEACYNLANALKDKGDTVAAMDSYRAAIDQRPNFPEALNNLGLLLIDHDLDQATSTCRKAIALRPDYPEAFSNLGTILKKRGELDEAIAACRRALALRPVYPEGLLNLGVALCAGGRLDEGIATYRQAIVQKSNYPDAYSNLGDALRKKGLLDDSINACQIALTLDPKHAEAHCNLGNALADKGQLDQAIIAYRAAMTLKANYAQANSNLGNALKDEGQLDESVAAYRQAIALDPIFHAAHSNLVYAMHFHPACSAGDIAKECRRWNQQHAQPLNKFIGHENDRHPTRRLRIGYVAPDFRDHCQSQFTLPLLSHHDHHRFEVFCYADVARPDAVTARLTGYADAWRSTVGMTDHAIADLVRQDRIDILIDLTLHMGNNRLLVFARKPAPVQVTWLGYPSTTGLDAIDYRLSDPYLDPPGMDESVYSEQTIRLPDSFWCYDPLDGRDIPVNPLPAMERGYITFGCLNNFCKVNESTLALWAAVLKKVDGSRLLMLAKEGRHRENTLNRLMRDDIDPARVEFVPYQRRPDYLRQYHRIDIGLDTFPYNGHTTSLDSYWMGVPVITLVGQTAVARAGWCQLSNLQLPELAAQTPEQFYDISTRLAADLARLAELRRSLRGRLEQSPLMNAARFAGNVETAYRRMWQSWCKEPAGVPQATL